ncbi:MAG: hypothetical protein LBQ75_08775 [Zoogloeaceae bacterium]|nr:hypothetical protein [Zoogloeaceae bacterium]
MDILIIGSNPRHYSRAGENPDFWRDADCVPYELFNARPLNLSVGAATCRPPTLVISAQTGTSPRHSREGGNPDL